MEGPLQPTTRDVVLDGNVNKELNEHLYSSILQCVREEPQVLLQGMDHRWGDGVALLCSLKNTYKGKLTMLEILQLQGKLLNPLTHLRNKDETVDSFASRTLQMYRELLANNVEIRPDMLNASFICGLGPEFTDVVKQLNTNSLPPEWQPLSITNLIEPARQVFRLTQQQRGHNVNYKNATKTSKPPKDQQKDTRSNPHQNNKKNRNHLLRTKIAKLAFSMPSILTLSKYLTLLKK